MSGARCLVGSALPLVFGSSLALAQIAAEPLTFTGMCDASAAAAIDAERFVVADDEDNVLRVFSRGGGEALFAFDFSAFLGNQGKKKEKEADLEAAASIGEHVFWITSHGRNAKGQEKPERQRLFATKAHISGGKVKIAAIGQPYSTLLDDLIGDPRLARYNLKEAAQLAPKEPGGLNIEGLASTPEGHLLIGFRNPVPGGMSLVVPLLNPFDAVNGKRAKLGAPVELQLGGLGIRSIERLGERYVIIAGATGEGGSPSRIFQWDGRGQPMQVPGVTLKGLNPEGVAFDGADGANEYLVLSDDGSRSVDGVDCKDLKDSSLKRFRGRLLEF